MDEKDMEKLSMNPSVEHLMANYLYYRNVVDLLPDDGEAGKVKKSCDDKLKKIDTLLNKQWRRKITLSWQLLHRVGEELILVMGEEELLAEGHKLLEDIKNSSVPDSVRNHWIELLHGKVTNLEKNLSDSSRCTQREIDATRHLFRTAAYTINECIDDRFWDISVKKFFSFIYGSLLLITGLVLCKTWLFNDQFCLNFFNIMLIGASGGLVSGLITADQEYLSKGHFWIPTMYYSLVRPTVGAVAAVIVFWMVESHYMIQVEPPLRDCCAFTCASSNSVSQAGKKGDCTDTGKTREQGEKRDFSLPGAAEAASRKSEKGFPQRSSHSSKKEKGTTPDQKKHPAANTGETTAKKTAPLKNDKGGQEESKKGDTSVITLRTVEGKQIYLYLLLLFFAGFSGDKILKSVSCKLNARMFADAEKTKEAKK